MTIATLRFTLADQRAFARLSGDFNPIHLDPVVSRRVAAGEPIVHGMHLLLCAIDAHLRHAPKADRWRIAAGFLRPALLGESVQVVRTGRNQLTLTIDGAVTLAIIEIAAVSSSPGAESALRSARRRHDRAARTPRVCSVAELDGAQGTMALPRAIALRRAFPRAAQALGGGGVAALAGLSRLIGMECPGRDSMLSAIRLDLTRRTMSSPLDWRVARVDARFGMVHLDVGGECVSGTADAFLRPRPAPAIAIETVAALVAPDEFAGQRALIIGGSRGLGAAAALLVAAGGGVPLVTFAAGAAEAAALRRDARRTGRRIEALRFDILTDPIARLARAAARFRPTHLYYFATPRIFARRREPFDDTLFQRFVAFYVTGFAHVCAAASNGSSTLDAFYPSSTAIDEQITELTEYRMAKAAGEALCGALQAATPGLRILVQRLPRVATDQTASLIHARALDPIAAMAPIVRALHRSGRPS